MRLGKQHLDERQTADVLGLKVTTLRDWRLKQTGPVYCKFGRAVRYPLDELEKFAEQAKVRAA